MKKVYPDAKAALAGLLKDGMLICCGGFGLCGIPETLIKAIRDSGVTGLTVVSNNAGIDGAGLGLLLETRQIAKMISSYVGENRLFADLYLKGELELEFNPQGTLAERIRAGGAGIPAFYTATGAGTLVAEGKETRSMLRPSQGIGGATIPGRGAAGRPATVQSPAVEAEEREYVLETGLYADLALVKARTADPFGNLVYRKTARNFNPMMATAAAFVIAEVEEMVGLGEIEPDCIHTPGNFVKRIVQSRGEKRIEQRTVRA